MNHVTLLTLWLTAILFFCYSIEADKNSCQRGQIAERKYLLYDINPGEGFNLRRDVYMRMAVLAKKLQEKGDWVLVLPPWGPLYHWKSKDVGIQMKLPWSQFFNVDSLRAFVPVMELSDLLKDRATLVVDNVFYLQHFKEAWTNGKWEEKFEFEKCSGNVPYQKTNQGLYQGWFWKHQNIAARNVSCVSFQGHSRKLIPLLSSFVEGSRSFMIDRAEIPLHDEYGNVQYWKVRRSMRFASRLLSLATDFRSVELNSDDISDGTTLPNDWRDEEYRPQVAKGGPYVCGHLRRQDFLRGRPSEVPSLNYAAKQLISKLKQMEVQTVFIASDGTDEEMKELEGYLSPIYKVVLYRPDLKLRQEIQDGGVAIVEQIICSRARYFIGTYESTFSFRIQEEREILHFPSETTFNRFCGDGQKNCEQPAKWKIVF